MIRTITSLIVIFLSYFIFTNAFAVDASHWKEHIIKLDSTIVVNQDASITVTEKFKAFANQEIIKHGVLRVLPLQINGSEIKYKMISAELDSNPIPYTTEQKGQKVLLFVGNKDKTLKRGYHQFTIKYQVLNAIEFKSNWDQLAWDIKGQDWNLPLLNIKTKVIVPNERKVEHYRADIAPETQKGMKYSVSKPVGNEIVISSKYLAPNATLNFDVAWQEGKVIRPPSFMDHVRKTIQQIIHMNWQQQAKTQSQPTERTVQ